MPDTGAPWNIPYVESADLVSAYPTASLALANAIADGLDDASLFQQIVQTVKTDTFSASLAAGAESGDVTGLTVSITPSSATNKVLIIPVVSMSTQTAGGWFTLYRDSTAIAIADASGSISRTTAGAGRTDDARAISTTPFIFLDSPGTTSAVTYSVRLRHGSTSTTFTVYVNRGNDTTNSAVNAHTASSITAIEVKA